jgi:hypothetical protein
MLGLISYSLIMIALFVGVWRRPPVAIAAVLCLYGLKQWGQSTTAFFSEYRQFTNFAVFAIVLLGLIRAAQMRSCVFCRTAPTSLLVLALFVYAFVSVSWAPDPQTSLDQWVISIPYIITITLLAPLLLNDLDDARTAFVSTAIAGAVLCALAMVFGRWGDRGLLLFGHDSLQDLDNIYRYETNPLALSTMAGVVFLICALSLGPPNRWFMRILAAACIPLALAVILRSGSRGQVLASGAAVFVALPVAFRLRDGRSIIMIAVVAGLVLGLGWWAASFVDIDSTRWADARTSQDVAGRIDMARVLMAASTANISTTVFGLGNSSAFHVLGIYPHITALEVVAEEGIIGAAIYFAILFLALRNVIRISGSASLTESNRNSLAILTGLFVFELILSWKQGTLLFSVYVFAYAIVLARLETPALKLAPDTVRESGMPTSLPRFPNLLR